MMLVFSVHGQLDRPRKLKSVHAWISGLAPATCIAQEHTRKEYLLGSTLELPQNQAMFSSQKFSPQSVISNLAAHAWSIKYRRKKLITQFG